MGLKRTDEFRQDAVPVALTRGLTRKQVESDFGRWPFDVEQVGFRRISAINILVIHATSA